MAKVIIGAEYAQELMTHNEHNRKINKARVSEYAEEMRNNMWLYNGESIILSETGKLLDGQHRLLAIIEADAEIETELIEGIPDNWDGVDTFLTINTKNRSNVDALTIAGFTDRPQSITKLMRFREAYDTKKLYQKVSGVNLLNHEVVELARDFGEEKALAIIDRAETLSSRCKLLALPYWILAVYVFQDLKDGNKFLEKIAECEGSKNGDPVEAYIYLLRKWDAMKAGGGAVSKGKWQGMFRAYNAMIDGSELKVMRFAKGSDIEYPSAYTRYKNG